MKSTFIVTVVSKTPHRVKYSIRYLLYNQKFSIIS